MIKLLAVVSDLAVLVFIGVILGSIALDRINKFRFNRHKKHWK